MAKRLRIDKAGRIVIPKPLRETLGLGPGDSLVAESSGQEITLRPWHEPATLNKEKGCWVYRTGRSLKNLLITDWLDTVRDERIGQSSQ